MPIPGSILNSQFPLGLDAASGMYPSLATLRPLTKTVSSTGQETHVFADSTDPAQVNLACRKSPLIQIRPQLQELDAGDLQKSIAKSQVNFIKSIAVPVLTLIEWQIKIDGRIYQIKSAELDGSGLSYRLMVSDEVMYNA